MFECIPAGRIIASVHEGSDEFPVGIRDVLTHGLGKLRQHPKSIKRFPILAPDERAQFGEVWNCLTVHEKLMNQSQD